MTDEQHHVIAATQTLLYDTNSLDAENTEALIGARRAVALIKELPPLVRILSPLRSPPHSKLPQHLLHSDMIPDTSLFWPIDRFES
jgi:hypothetical protein